MPLVDELIILININPTTIVQLKEYIPTCNTFPRTPQTHSNTNPDLSHSEKKTFPFLKEKVKENHTFTSGDILVFQPY